MEIVVCGWIFQWFPAKSSGKHREHGLAKLLAFGQRGKRTEWRPPDSTGIMVFGSGGPHQPMPPSADEPVTTSTLITETRQTSASLRNYERDELSEMKTIHCMCTESNVRKFYNRKRWPAISLSLSFSSIPTAREKVEFQCKKGMRSSIFY
jgi:hypothetical protein